MLCPVRVRTQGSRSMTLLKATSVFQCDHQDKIDCLKQLDKAKNIKFQTMAAKNGGDNFKSPKWAIFCSKSVIITHLDFYVCAFGTKNPKRFFGSSLDRHHTGFVTLSRFSTINNFQLQLTN